MNKELAKTLTTALVQFIDRERPEDTMCCSNAECASIEQMLEGEHFNIVEVFIQKKLSRLTEFERDVRDVIVNALTTVHESSNGQITSSVVMDDNTTHLIAAGLLKLAKKELTRRNEVIILDKLSYDKELQDGKSEAMADLEKTYFCNPDKLPKWLKDDIAKRELNAHTKGYNKGYKDAEKQYNESVAYHFPIMPTPPNGWGCDGTHCTNPHRDCINCPVRDSSGTITTPNTASVTSIATLPGNISATDGKSHNPSFTD